MLYTYSYILSATEKAKGIKSTGQNLLEFFGIILIFIIVLVACWATTRFVASKQLAGKNMGNFEVVETYAVTRDRYLQVIRIGTKYFAIAVGKDSINVICELSKDELNFDKKANGTVVNGFSNVLSAFLKKDSDKAESKDNE